MPAIEPLPPLKSWVGPRPESGAALVPSEGGVSAREGPTGAGGVTASADASFEARDPPCPSLLEHDSASRAESTARPRPMLHGCLREEDPTDAKNGRREGQLYCEWGA
jgi:hypothetical protein